MFQVNFTFKSCFSSGNHILSSKYKRTVSVMKAAFYKKTDVGKIDTFCSISANSHTARDSKKLDIFLKYLNIVNKVQK
jgi:hypothetical protein